MPILTQARRCAPPNPEIHNGLRGQARAALLTATLDYQTTGLGRHAGEESDSALAATVRGLKCSFHLLIPSILKLMLLPISCSNTEIIKYIHSGFSQVKKRNRAENFRDSS